MKKQVTGLSFIVIAISIVLSSYREGPESHGWDCTGAETGLGNPKGCSSGSGCHATAANAGITVAIELDSAGSSVTNYVGGKTYTLKLTGTNTTTSSLPGFGYQMSCIKGSVAKATPADAGTWSAAPASQITAPQSGNFVLTIIEQSNTIGATSGGGAPGSTYIRSIPWTAPVAGTGTVSFWGALNAVNGNGTNDHGDLWNTNHLVISEEDSVATQHTTGIVSLLASANIKVYPNPVNDVLNLQFGDVNAGSYTVSVYNINGQVVATERMDFIGANDTKSVNTLTWSAGIYIVKIEGNDCQQVFKVVKQ